MTDDPLESSNPWDARPAIWADARNDDVVLSAVDVAFEYLLMRNTLLEGTLKEPVIWALATAELEAIVEAIADTADPVLRVLRDQMGMALESRRMAEDPPTLDQ